MSTKWKVLLGLGTVVLTIGFIFKYIENIKPKIALISIKGEIRDSIPEIRKLESVYKNDSFKAVVIRVESPGGAVGASQEIYRAVERLKKKKPVIVSMGNITASGGFYLSMPATEIFANKGTVTGSIGVIIQHKNLKGLLDKLGIQFENVKSGKNKDLLNIAEPLKGEKKEILQETVLDVYNQFIDAILKYRKIDKEKLISIADGRVFSGEKAKEYGLVDKLGNLQDAIDEAKAIGKCQDCEIIMVNIKSSLLGGLLKGNLSSIINSSNLLNYLNPDLISIEF